nr:hypothetical protein CFP56_66778 [Quercus suber]
MADERNGGIFMAGDDCIGIQCGYKECYMYLLFSKGVQEIYTEVFLLLLLPIRFSMYFPLLLLGMMLLVTPKHSRIQPVMLLVTPKYFLGYSVQFSRGLVYPISSFRLCYRYGYKIDLKHGHQKLVSKSGWPDKAIIFASKSPVDSPNTNRIHLEETNNVKKYNLFISTGDDCIYANWNQFC